MKRLVHLIAFFVIMTTSAFADTVVPSDRVTSAVIVRQDPVPGAPEVGRLRPRESAQYLGEAPHRYRVQLTNGVEGFVSKSWTRRVPDAPTTGNLEIHFIDVGQGDSTLVVCPNGRKILVDAGSTGGAQVDAIRDYILAQLDRHERRINTLVITHPDTDHYNLLDDVLVDVPVDRVIRVGELTDYNMTFRNWLNGPEIGPITIIQTPHHDPMGTPNAELQCGTAQIWIIGAAVQATQSAKNAASIVLMIRLGNFEAILTGDATHNTETFIINNYPNTWLDVDVLKIGHHGSLATSTSQQWADAVRPITAIVSAGFTNSHGHPRQEVIERLDDHTRAATAHPMRHATGTRPNYTITNIPNYAEDIYSTAVSGSVIVGTSGNGHTVQTRQHEP